MVTFLPLQFTLLCLAMLTISKLWAMFYFLAFNSGLVFSSNAFRYIFAGIGFVYWDFSKVFSYTFRLDMAVLTLRAVIK